MTAGLGCLSQCMGLLAQEGSAGASSLVSAFWYCLSPVPLLLLVVGTALGVTVGAIPGLTGAMLISLSLPLTFSMRGTDAMVLLVSMYVGSVSGGLITATLLRMPGTPASIMTTLDGYPLAQRGLAGRALGLGISASLAGGLISGLFLVLLSEPIAVRSTELGPFEYFALVMMAMALISSVSGPSLLRGLLAGLLGMLATMPGVAPATGDLRWTMGLRELDDGLRLLPVLIGLFAVSQTIADVMEGERQTPMVRFSRQGLWLTPRDWWQHKWNMLRSSLIGTLVGILPGIGANIGSIVAYSAARGVSRRPAEFGRGSEAGIVASETANNATVGGALIPLVAMGIPGSVIDAILLGALIIHGVQPGPLLFENDPRMVRVIMATYLLSTVVMYAFTMLSVGSIAAVGGARRTYLLPTVLVFCVVGTYALSHRMFDAWVMLAFGVLGVALERLKLPLAPFVIGFVLAPIAEANLGKGLVSTNGDWWPALGLHWPEGQPWPAVISGGTLAFDLIAIALLLWPFGRRWWRDRSGTAET
jgi:putative tricarboxylic transport membrane protein